MTTQKNANKKKLKAQSLVEFALILPILLLLMIGLIDTGRVLFQYSTVTNAAREAARYGAASGDEGGTIHFMDCTGMRNAALNTSPLQPFSAGEVTIYYDSGPGTSKLSDCPPSDESIITEGVRVVVEVESQFTGIIPGGPLNNVKLKSKSARTIMRSIQIANTPSSGTNAPTTIGGTLVVINTETDTPQPTITSGGPTVTRSRTPTPSNTFTPTSTPTSSTRLPTLTDTPSITPNGSWTPTRQATLTETPTAMTCSPISKVSTLLNNPGRWKLAITNGTSASLHVQDIYLSWDTQGGNTLISVTLGGTELLSATQTTSPTRLYPVSRYIPVGSADLVLTFSKNSYNGATSDKIYMRFYNNGCQSSPIDTNTSRVTLTPTP